MLRAASLTILLFLPSSVLGAPAITAVSGPLTRGAMVTITGSGFGTKSQAAPFLWDDFEGSVVGAPVAGNKGWEEYGARTSHRYTDTTAYSGARAALSHSQLLPDWFNAVLQSGLNADELYLSFYVKYRKASGTYAGNTVLKFLRINSRPDPYHSKPMFWVTKFPRDDSWFYAGGSNVAGEYPQQDLCGGDAAACSAATTPMDGGPFGRFEAWFKLSTPGVADGLASTWWNYRRGYDQRSIVTRQASEAAQKLDSFIITGMNDERGGDVIFDYVVDDVYADVTPARVEVCDRASWAARTHCEPQIPSAWTTASITVAAIITGFPVGAPAYLYVVDATGAANATGFPVAIGGAPNTTPPSAPTGLRVR